MMEADYTELQIHLSEQGHASTGLQLRRLASAALQDQGEAVDPLHWHRHANGTTITESQALARSSGRRDGDLLRVVAVGNASDALRRDGHKITRSISCRLGRALGASGIHRQADALGLDTAGLEIGRSNGGVRTKNRSSSPSGRIDTNDVAMALFT